MAEPGSARERLRVLVAFATIYLVWGSTFLAIRVALAGLPPMLLCGLRLSCAGATLLAWALATRQRWPRGREWANALAVGLLLPAFGNSSVTLGETHVPSGVVALLLGTIPLWMALLASLGPGGVRPAPVVLLGLLLGFGGVALLIGPGLADPRAAEIPPFWALIPVLGSASWAWGTLWSRRVRMPASPLMATAIGLTGGGIVLLLASGLLGEWARFSPARVSAPAWLALLYLSAFGSVVGFSAYLFLLKRVPPAVVSTYAFINPIVAMVLGVTLGHEAPSLRTLSAAAIVVVAVILIISARAPAVARAAAGAHPAVARRP